MSEEKHSPTRTCIITRTKHSKSDLIRITKIKETDNYKILIDEKHNLGGRGIYINPEVNFKQIKKALDKNKIGYMLKLGRKLSSEEKGKILEYFEDKS